MSNADSEQGSDHSSIGFKSWWMVAVLFFLYVFSWLDRLILSMLVGPIKQDLLLSDFQISLILGPAFAICYSLFGLPMGWAVDRYPRRWVVYFEVPGLRRSRSTCMSSTDNSNPGGQPSTTQPRAGPWLSPKVVTVKSFPKVFPDMTRTRSLLTDK